MRTATISTAAQADEATPPAALKTKRAALHTILPGETPVQAAIRATEAQRKVMETAYEAYSTAEVAASKAKAALKAAPFPDALIVAVAPVITEDHTSWPIEMIFRHPDGREVSNPITTSRTQRLETRDAVVAHFGDDHPELQERLAAFDRWDAETAPLRRALERAEKAEQKTDRAWQRSYELNDRLCRAVLEVPAEPHEASQQADAYIRLLASSNGRDVQPKDVMYGEEAAPLLRFMHRALKRPDPTPPSPMLDALAERNLVVDQLNGDNDFSDEEFDRQHGLGWDLNNRILDDASLSPDSVLAKLRLILRTDVVEGLQFNEEAVHGALRSAIAVLEAEHPSLRRVDTLLDEADSARVWIDVFLNAGGVIGREDGGDGADRITFNLPTEQPAQCTGLFEAMNDAPATFIKEVERQALTRMIRRGVDALSSSAPAADTIAEPRAPFMLPVLSDQMEPTLRRGRDHVVLVPVDRFEFDEIYAVRVDGADVLYRCQSDFKGGVLMSPDNQTYSSRTVSREQFASMVVGRAIGDLHIRDRDALPVVARPAVFAQGHLIAAE